MKKSLVLAMAMALGVTASAYAANPFSDVPAGHWAYDSISKLAAAGVIEGYGDTTFGGDKLMTRYEMAQIVAKAMAKGANCDKLAAEFADELDNLGVRVANLEKKADNVKITGQIRAHYKDVKDGKSAAQFRTRLFVSGAINEDWTYTGRLQNVQEMHGENKKSDPKDRSNVSEDDTKLNWAFVSGKIGGVKVDAGRMDIKLHTGTVVDETFDAVKVAYGKDIKLTGVAAKTPGATAEWDRSQLEGGDRMYIADLSTKIGVVDTYLTYYNTDATKEIGDIYVLGAAAKVAKDLTLKAEWLNGDADANNDENGYMVGLSYKGAKASAVGSWGIYANYYDQPIATMLEQTIDGYATLPTNYKTQDGFKGFEIGANYTVAKNIVAAVKYYDLEEREGDSDNVKTLWSEVVFTF